MPSILAEYAVVQEIDEDSFGPLHNELRVLEYAATTGWRRLDWIVDDHIRQECVAAEERAKVVAEDSDDSVLWFNEYGAEWITKNAGANQVSVLTHCNTGSLATAGYGTALGVIHSIYLL